MKSLGLSEIELEAMMGPEVADELADSCAYEGYLCGGLQSSAMQLCL